MAVQPSQQLSLDTAAQGGFIRYFNSLAEKSSTTIRIFDRNDYYTVHGEDAIFTANTLFHTSAVIKHLGSGERKLPSVILSKLNFESFARDLLLVKQYRVEIFCCKSKSANDWRVAFKASPGNLQQLEDVLFGSLDLADSLTMMSVKLATENGQRMLGVAFNEPSSEHLGIAEFIENDQFSNLEALIMQLRPKECLVVAHDSHTDARKLTQILQRSGVLVTERKRSEFSNADIVQDLERLLSLQSGASAAALAQLDLTQAMCSLEALIKYLDLLSDDSNFGVFKLTTFDFSQYLRLDTAASKALNIEPQPGDQPTCHLAGMLNHCATPQGQRLLVQWLRQPLLDKERIEERLDMVEILFSDLTLRRNVQSCLKAVPDYFRLAKKINRGKGTLQDCVRIYQSVCKLPTLISALSGYDGSSIQLLTDLFITPLKEAQEDFSKYREMVETTIDLELSDNHEYVIQPSFDEHLIELRGQMETIESQINKELKKASKELELELYKAIKLDFNNQRGYVFRITKKSEKCLRARKHYCILDAPKDGVRFSTATMDGLNQDYLSLKRDYSTTQATLVSEVMQIAGGYSDPMLTLNSILAQLDVLVSFAHASAMAPIPYVRPTITPKGEGDLVLTSCRHPCMEVQDNISFIANEVKLLRERESFQIITGPNMGGKSTYMRQIGVTVLMAQSGCFVPCSSASICIVDSILARVGAGDSQLKGVSTFMAEMLETASILKSATKDSLVIIDELGRGTSTYDGFGLAWAISEHIAKEIGCFCLFATHFHELTQLANEITTVKNLHVTALTTNDTLTLLYRVKPGVCDQSFGLHVAELAHFPAEVIEFAKKKVKDLEIWNSYQIKDCLNRSEDHLSNETPPAKRRKMDDQEIGEKIISDFLDNVQELSSLDISDADMKVKFDKLKLDFMSADNAYVKAILNTISS